MDEQMIERCRTCRVELATGDDWCAECIKKIFPSPLPRHKIRDSQAPCLSFWKWSRATPTSGAGTAKVSATVGAITATASPGIARHSQATTSGRARAQIGAPATLLATKKKQAKQPRFVGPYAGSMIQ